MGWGFKYELNRLRNRTCIKMNQFSILCVLSLLIFAYASISNTIDKRNRRPCLDDCKSGFILDRANCLCISSESSSSSSQTSSSESMTKSIESTATLSSSSEFLPASSSSNERFLPSLPSPRYCPNCHSSRFKQNPDTCECYCDIECNDTFDTIATITEDCECIRAACDIFCEKGFVIDWANCTHLCRNCKCIPDQSPSDQCNRDTIICAQGFIFDSKLCDCVPLRPSSCPQGFVYDEEKSQCVCANCGTCPDFYEWNNETCECFCSTQDRKCPQGKFFDPQLCKCSCAQNAVKCKRGFYFNQKTCRCSCVQTKMCVKGFVFDDDLCKCVKDLKKPFCSGGFVFDPVTCGCVCEFRDECPNLQIYDEHLCQCVCPNWIECEETEKLNEINCYCERSMKDTWERIQILLK